VKQAAEFLGVSTATLRNWDRCGKLKPRRHPQNGYRIYLHEDLSALLQSAQLPSASDEAAAPRFDWTILRDSEHIVQFYESDAYLIQCVSEFVGAALNQNDASLVVATSDHRIALQRKLVAQGVDVAAAIESGRYVVVDAADTLAKFMTDGVPDSQRMREHVGELMAQLGQGGRRIHAFGEMVALLWEQGSRHAAIRLEELWNELGAQYRFALFCAYPMQNFGDEDDAVPFNGICSCHTRVIPAESYSDIDSEDERLRAISMLQQKAQALSAEIDHRAAVQIELAQRERELAEFVEHTSEGLEKVSRDGIVLWANTAKLQLLACDRDEYIGRSIADFFVDGDQARQLLDRIHKGDSFRHDSVRLRANDGSAKHISLSGTACFENGEIRSMRLFSRDITPQWLAKQALGEGIT
jgi:PAS domain S-box-containing protein